jgi:hypothetical protein
MTPVFHMPLHVGLIDEGIFVESMREGDFFLQGACLSIKDNEVIELSFPFKRM